VGSVHPRHRISPPTSLTPLRCSHVPALDSSSRIQHRPHGLGRGCCFNLHPRQYRSLPCSSPFQPANSSFPFSNKCAPFVVLTSPHCPVAVFCTRDSRQLQFHHRRTRLLSNLRSRSRLRKSFCQPTTAPLNSSRFLLWCGRAADEQTVNPNIHHRTPPPPPTTTSA